MAYKQSQAGDENIFRLSALSDTVQPLSITHFFEQQPTPIENLATAAKATLPTFNKDSLYFTPTFLLPSQTNFYKMNENYHRYLFDKRIEENQMMGRLEPRYERIELIPPNSKYCQICQQKFENYFEHTVGKEHAELAKNNAFNISMHQLCCVLTDQQRMTKCDAGKKIKKSHSGVNPRKPETRAAKNANPNPNKSNPIHPMLAHK